jgi:hypothetical protein
MVYFFQNRMTISWATAIMLVVQSFMSVPASCGCVVPSQQVCQIESTACCASQRACCSDSASSCGKKKASCSNKACDSASWCACGGPDPQAPTPKSTNGLEIQKLVANAADSQLVALVEEQTATYPTSTMALKRGSASVQILLCVWRI